MYYHVRLSVEGQRHDEIKADIDEETLERQFLVPYRSGTPITVNGKSIPIDRIERLRISASDVPTDQIVPILRDEDARSRVAVLGGPSYTWRAAARATDTTDQFITGPPGEQKGPLIADAQGATAQEVEGEIVGSIGSDRKDVFLVAGRDNEAVSAVKSLLRALGLRIVEWEHAVAKTGLPNPYVGDIVEEGLRMADVAVVLHESR